MEQALALYPDNKVCWAHMGLSYEIDDNEGIRTHIAGFVQRLTWTNILT